MAKREPKWTQRTFKIPDGIKLAAKPGCNIFIAERGAVCFDYPKDWHVMPGESGAIKFHDRLPPDDDCVLQVSVMRLPPVQGGWSGLPLERMIREMVREDPRGLTGGDEIITLRRGDTDIAWSEARFIDPNELRPAFTRGCLARNGLVQPLITMEFWESDAARFGPVWDDIIESLKVGLTLPGPPRGDMN